MKRKIIQAQSLLSKQISGTISNIVCQKNGRFRVSVSRKKRVVKKTEKQSTE